jgi:hypothetical protein
MGATASQSCAYENPKAYNASDLADLGIGGTQQVTGTCTTAGRSEGKWCPNNGEFVSGPSRACAFNTTNNDGRQFHCGPKDSTWGGCGGIGSGWEGQCEIVGSSTKCERRSFSADPAACCKANGTKIIGGKTCDPKYQNSSNSSCIGISREYCKTLTSNPDRDTACKNFMASSNTNDNDIRNTYCSRGDNLFNDRMCSSWVTKPKSSNQVVIDTLMREKCKGNNMGRDPCKSYVINRSTKDSSYDSVMTKYCIQNPESLLCRCIMSKHNENTNGSLKGRPECIDPACAGEQGAESPFKTFDMNQNSDNCSYTNCQQWVDLGPTIGVENINVVDLTQNCGNTNYVDPADAAPVGNTNFGAPSVSQNVNSNGAPVLDSLPGNLLTEEGMDNQTKGIIGLLLFVAVLFFLFVGLPLIVGPSYDMELNDYDMELNDYDMELNDYDYNQGDFEPYGSSYNVLAQQ